jgi:ACS family tartrate transporter-like MFS transporter
MDPVTQSGAPPTDSADPGPSALAKASWRLLPLLGVAYGVAYMDRVNISFAAVRMNADLHFSATVYGLGGGLFFLAYALFEVPSNLVLARVGARRWLARIMLTWGLLAAGMMFVRTPTSFYVMRFLLGAAEAGFFPGAVYYLMSWFPARHRGRAISRFYVAFPLSNVVMGAVAGTLLGLQGRLGLAGWQWLFLMEGLPAVGLSVIFLFWLPDGPETAVWLSAAEKAWIARRLAAETTIAGVVGPTGAGVGGGLRAAILNPMVLAMGVVNLLYLGAGYAFSLSGPALLEDATHLGIAKIGYLIALGGLMGGAAMIVGAWNADRVGERHLHVALPLAMEAAGYGMMAFWHSPVGMIAGYLTTAVAHAAAAAVFWLIPTDVLRGRNAAVGVAAVNAIGMIGSFLGPWAWGVAKDATGGYQAGLASLPMVYLLAAGVVLALRAARPAPAALAAPAG